MKNELGKNRWWIFLARFFVLAVGGVAIGCLKAEEGIPRTLGELNSWYVEPATNGAVYFLDAYAVLSNNVPLKHYTNADGKIGGYIDWPEEIPVTNGPLPRTVRNELKPFVQSVEMAWPVLEQGANCKQSRYPLDLTQGWSALLYHLRDLQGDVMGCCLRAIAKADAQNADAAANSVLMALSVAQSLKAEPLLISQLIRGRHQRMAIEGMEQVVNRACLPTNTLEHLQEVFNRLEMEETKGDAFERAWIGEKVMADSYMELSSNGLCQLGKELNEQVGGGTWITTNQLPVLIAKALATRSQDKKEIDDGYDKILALCKQGYPKRFEIDGIFHELMADLGKRQFIFAEMTDSPPKNTEREAAIIVRLRLAKTAMALERYRAAHDNQYPDSLKALVPDFLTEMPEDIFADSPLLYLRRGDGYLLYSVGPDRTNNGGSRKEDILFETFHPPGRAVIQ